MARPLKEVQSLPRQVFEKTRVKVLSNRWKSNQAVKTGLVGNRDGAIGLRGMGKNTGGWCKAKKPHLWGAAPSFAPLQGRDIFSGNANNSPPRGGLRVTPGLWLKAARTLFPPAGKRSSIPQI